MGGWDCCVAGCPNLKEVDIAEPKEENDCVGAGSESLVVPFVVGAVVVVIVLARAPNNGLEVELPNWKPPVEEPKPGAPVTGAGAISFFGSSVAGFAKLNAKSGLDSSVAPAVVILSLDSLTDCADAKREGLDGSA